MCGGAPCRPRPIKPRWSVRPPIPCASDSHVQHASRLAIGRKPAQGLVSIIPHANPTLFIYKAASPGTSSIVEIRVFSVRTLPFEQSINRLIVTKLTERERERKRGKEIYAKSVANQRVIKKSEIFWKKKIEIKKYTREKSGHTFSGC